LIIIIKDVMKCPGTHPPWHCKVFGKLPAREREKIIKDNRLCPFCLLHDKDKPCGAKQKPVACSASNCKGRHIGRGWSVIGDRRGSGHGPPTSQWEDAEAAEDGWRAPGPGDLLIEGEEGEYFLEFLMREAPSGKPNPASQPFLRPPSTVIANSTVTAFLKILVFLENILELYFTNHRT
jgi:hypothetical protein